MTKKLFWHNPYQVELATSVTSVQDNDITVQETIFYAFSGAQESDYGTIADKRVVQARKEGKDIIYTLEDGHNIKLYDQVAMVIDWQRRYSLMRLHFAAELILVLINKHLKGIEKIGAHISQEKARIDFKWSENISLVFPQIKQEAQEIINADHAIISAFSDEENQKRYWEIEGFARVPCGGTHPKKTSEIGRINLKRDNRGKGQERIVITIETLCQ